MPGMFFPDLSAAVAGKWVEAAKVQSCARVPFPKHTWAHGWHAIAHACSCQKAINGPFSPFQCDAKLFIFSLSKKAHLWDYAVCFLTLALIHTKLSVSNTMWHQIWHFFSLLSWKQKFQKGFFTAMPKKNPFCFPKEPFSEQCLKEQFFTIIWKI